MADGIVLVLNAGSSSVKFRIAETTGRALYEGAISGIGSNPAFKLKDGAGKAVPLDLAPERIDEHEDALDLLLEIAARFLPGRPILAAGHRVVHGGLEFAEPVLVDDGVLARLEAFVPLAPLHQPHNLAAIRALARLRPDLPQVACFDTAFHVGQDRIARLFGLPRALIDEGVFRYGFHGLSYQAIAERMPGVMGTAAAGKVIVAHLGNGASLCAMADGRAMGSTMGFTAVDGLPMGTRTGQLDPGVILHLLTTQGLSPAAIETLIYKESGLLGLSGISGDWRRLEAAGPGPAAEAIAYFTHRALREIGGLAATMGGMDTLVFTAGIGENAAGLRRDIANGLAWLGVRLDAARNEAGEEIFSTPDSSVTLMVVPTDEEAVIASHTRRFLAD